MLLFLQPSKASLEAIDVLNLRLEVHKSCESGNWRRLLKLKDRLLVHVGNRKKKEKSSNSGSGGVNNRSQGEELEGGEGFDGMGFEFDADTLLKVVQCVLVHHHVQAMALAVQIAAKVL